MPTAETLSQGDEVVTGQVVDSNAAWLSSRCVELGFDVVRHTAVGDRLDHLVGVLRSLAGRSDLCLGTGGLGPTVDDLTSEAVAAAFGRPLHTDSDVLAGLQRRYAAHGRVMAPTNARQARLPEGATWIANDWGTAPGFQFVEQGTRFAFLPGVPREMKAMFDARLAPELPSVFGTRPGRLVTVRVVGLGESDVQQRLLDLVWPEGVVFGTRTSLPENHVKLRCAPEVPEATIRSVVAEVVARLGGSVLSTEGLGQPGGSLAEVVGRHLRERGETLAVAESCTGGRIAAACTTVPGASDWFLGGLVGYANETKTRLAGVPSDLIAAHGAVSEAVARALADGCRERLGATWTLSTTGIAGPGGGTPDKPVGTVWIGMAGPQGTAARSIRLPGDRDRVQNLAAATALDTLRRTLSGPTPLD